MLRLSGYLPYRLSVASNEVSRLIASAYSDRFGLSIPQWRLLAVLAETEGLSQQDLVGRTAMDKVTISRAAKALVDRHLIERTIDRSDARASRLALTQTGRAIHAEIAPLALKLEAELLDGLSKADEAALARALDHLTRRAQDLSNTD
jgi:DNA-binding MarR family transcriptional regulator